MALTAPLWIALVVLPACHNSDDTGDTADTGTACEASLYYPDADGDGFGSGVGAVSSCSAPEVGDWASDGTDCDDADANVYPGAYDSCDGIDSDCDGATDEDEWTTWYADEDGDGYGDAGDTKLACDAPAGTVDNGEADDDDDPTVYPGAVELCDGLDNDQDGEIDEAVPTWYRDVDGDGVGGDVAVEDCDPVEGHTAETGDCDDSDPAVHPGAPEVCDGVDQDCDDEIDELATDTVYWLLDSDGDGYGDDDLALAELACSPSGGHTDQGGDCDDSDATVHPGAAEACDGVDSDCDGETDEDAVDADTFWTDADGDGYGDPGAPLTACEAPSGSAGNAEDCDDADPAVNPDLTWYRDADGDGYGDAGSSTTACEAPSGHVADATDCDDTWADTHPGASESCDGVDTDCDGTVDEDAIDAPTWYGDGDGDGYGLLTDATAACEAPSGTVAWGTDCDDGDPAISPAATESCDGVDNDCDHVVDEDDAEDATTWYADDDGDGLGDAGSPAAACELPPGHAESAGDCDDTDASVGAATTWYADADGDGYGDASTTTEACDAPTGYLADASDCDDTESAVYPGAVELCDGRANDCDTESTWVEDDEDGVVSLQETSTGVWTDLSAELAAGTADSPARVTTEYYTDLRICDGTYYVNLELYGGSYTQQTITGSGSDAVVLDGGGQDRVVSFYDTYSGSHVRLEGLTLTGGSTPDSGGCAYLYTVSEFHGTDLVFEDCEAGSYGGGLYLHAATAVFEDVVIRDNVAENYGGGLAGYTGSSVLDRVEVSDNEATLGWGGGVYLTSSNSSWTDCAITGNTARSASAYGGGMALYSGTTDLTDCEVSGNRTDGNGGGLGIYPSSTWVNLVETTIHDNESGYLGPGLWTYGQVSCEGSTTSDAGVFDNASDTYADHQVYVYYAGDYTSDTCDHASSDGEAGGIRTYYGGLSYEAGDDDSFTCDDSSCG